MGKTLMGGNITNGLGGAPARTLWEGAKEAVETAIRRKQPEAAPR